MPTSAEQATVTRPEEQVADEEASGEEASEEEASSEASEEEAWEEEASEEESQKPRSEERGADEKALRAFRAASPELQERWEGDDPSKWFGVKWGDGRVRELDLNGCSWKELPTQVVLLTGLTTLKLDHTNLTALPAELGRLTGLTLLNLNECKQLTALPAELGRLLSLTELDLKGCTQLTALPAELGLLVNLTRINLEGCDQLTLPPGAPANATAHGGHTSAPPTIAAYARLLIVEPRKDTPGQLHDFLLATPLAVPPFFKFILTDAAHADWLGKAVEADPDLPRLTDFSRRSAIDVAHPACKRRMQAALLHLKILHTAPASRPEVSAAPQAPAALAAPGPQQRVPWQEQAADEEAVRALRAASSVLQERWEGDDPSKWLGVQWDDGRVRELLLEEQPSNAPVVPLKELPAELGRLTALTRLDLSWCEQLTALPAELGQLVNLTTLNLGGCSQLEELPAGFGQLTGLTTLKLWDCKQLTALPAELGQLVNLTELYLDRCDQLTSLPAELGQLTALTTLDLSYCKQLTALPAELGQLTGLTTLNLAGYPLKELPAELGQLTGLTELNLAGYPLKELPAEVWQLTGLTTLDLSGCEQLTALPAELGQLVNLTSLYLHGCSQLEELPAELGRLTALTTLRLWGCKQLKALPTELGQLVNLARLDLAACHQLTLPPGAPADAKETDFALPIIAAYAPMHIVEPRKPEQLHAFLLATPLAVPPFFKYILAAAAHADWLGEAVEATPDLASLADPDGRRAIDVAHPACKHQMQVAAFLLGRYELEQVPPEHRSATSVVLRAKDHSNYSDYEDLFQRYDTNGDGQLEWNEVHPLAAQLGLSAELLFGEKHDDKGLSCDEFVGACKRLLGDGPRRVVLKLMQNPTQWQRECKARSTKHRLDPKYVVLMLNSDKDEEVKLVKEEIGKLSGGLRTLKDKFLPAGYTFGAQMIVMDAADRNLQQIFQQEQPDTNAVRTILSEVLEAVAFLHERRLMHGDIKMLNIVRFARDGRLRLIDFDAAAVISPDEDTRGYAAAKFSSGTLPPQLFHVLKSGEAEQLKEYWSSSDEAVRDKVAPRKTKAGRAFVVKSFRTTLDNPTELADIEKLPYALVPASENIDTWACGAMAFLLLSGAPIIPLTRDDDCATAGGMALLERWGTNNDEVLDTLNKIVDEKARDLVSLLLQREPRDRWSAKQAREHPFFHPHRDEGGTMTTEMQKLLKEMNERTKLMAQVQKQQGKKLELLVGLSLEHRSELKRSSEALMKAIFEATEVQMPTCFVVLQKKLPKEEEEEEWSHVKVDEEGKGVTLGNKDVGLFFTAEGVQLEGEKVEKCKSRFEAGMKWMGRIKTIGSEVAKGLKGVADTEKIFKTIKACLMDFMTGETMYFYLVDELTGKPVQAEGYPIEIRVANDTGKELVAKLLPVMQVGLRAMSIYNGVAGLAHCFGYPVPSVPKSWKDNHQKAIEILKQESSVEDFGVVHTEVMSGDEQSKTPRGASLRELQKFFENSFNKDGKYAPNFAGLNRIGDPEDGTALWTTLTKPEEIQEALAERMRQRQKEQLTARQLLEEPPEQQPQPQEPQPQPQPVSAGPGPTEAGASSEAGLDAKPEWKADLEKTKEDIVKEMKQEMKKLLEDKPQPACCSCKLQ